LQGALHRAPPHGRPLRAALRRRRKAQAGRGFRFRAGRVM